MSAGAAFAAASVARLDLETDMTHKILQGLSEALYHAKRDTTDPRALVEALLHYPATHERQIAAADALTAALDRAEKAEALVRDTAWNDAIDAAKSRVDTILQGYAIEKGNTKTPEGRTANFYRRKVKEAVVALKKGAKP